MNAFSFDLCDGDQVLCLGAHCDDIELGCAGTLLELRASGLRVDVSWVVFSGDERRAGETRAARRALLGDDAVRVLQFRNSYFPAQWADIKNEFEALKTRHQPRLVFTHFRGDLHQDHRVVSELTWNTFRDHAILEYEIPKYDGDLAPPNAFVAVSKESLETKIGTLERCFDSQRSRPWFDPVLFRGLARMRGAECNSPSGFAEGFHCRKAVLGLRSGARQ